MDEPCNCHTFQRLMADKEKWAQVQDLTSEGYAKYQGNAPGETARICRKVGAHRKEAQGKANHTPAQREYGKAYNRLKARKQRGKISEDEWNSAVAKAQELVAQSERGALTDENLKRLLAEL